MVDYKTRIRLEEYRKNNRKKHRRKPTNYKDIPKIKIGSKSKTNQLYYITRKRQK